MFVSGSDDLRWSCRRSDGAMVGTSVKTVSTSPTLRRLLLDRQTWCSADCCKATAFDLSANAIRQWLEAERIDRRGELAGEIGAIRTDLRQANGTVRFAVRGLESSWGADAFRSFWDHFSTAFEAAVDVRS